MFDRKELLVAYKRLKSFCYRDGADLFLRKKIAEFEYEFKDEDALNIKLASIVRDLELFWSEGLVPSWMEQISFQIFPKKLEPISQPEVQTFIKSLEKSSDFKLCRTLLQIQAGVEVHFVSILWTMFVGVVFDELLSDSVYSNRLNSDEDKDMLKYSTRLFRPYYKDYASWRNGSIEQVKSAHELKNNATIISLDIKDYYYNVDLDLEAIVHDPIKIDIELKTDQQKILNRALHQVHEIFHKKIGASKKLLPIGLPSSGVLGNYALHEVDSDIKESINPIYYGRYVDDIIMVVQNLAIDDHKFFQVLDALFKKTKRIKLEKYTDESNPKCIKERTNINFKTSYGAHCAQMDKLKIFDFHKDAPISLLEEFEREIERFSSEGRLLAEDMDVLERFNSESRKISYSDSIFKLRSIEKFDLNRLGFSRFLSSLIQTSRVTTKIQEDDFQYIHAQIISIVTGQDAILTYRLWEKLVSIYVSHNRIKELEEFVIEIMGGIHKLDISSDVNSFTPKSVHIPSLSDSQIRSSWFSYLARVIILSFSAAGGYKDLKRFHSVLESTRATVFESERKAYRTRLSSDFAEAELEIKQLRKSAMFRHNFCPVPMVAFCKDNDDLDFNTLRDNLGKGFEGSFQWETANLKIKLSPRFINYSEISELHIIQSLKSGNSIALPDLVNQVNVSYREFNLIPEADLLEGLPKVYGESKEDGASVDDLSQITIRIDKKHSDVLRVGVANVDIPLTYIEQRFAMKPDLSHSRLIELNRVLNIAVREREKVDLLVFPEVFIPFEWIDYVASFCKVNNISVVAGLEHVLAGGEVYNYMVVIMPFSMNGIRNVMTGLIPKADLNKDESKLIKNIGMVQGKVNYQKIVFEWNGAQLSLLNCLELSDIRKRSWMRGVIDCLVAIENNSDTSYFSSIVESTARDLHCYVVQVNNSKFGDSRITGPLPSVQRDMLRVKGGENKTVLVQSLPINELRRFQHFGDSYEDLGGKVDFKPLSPNFPRPSSKRMPSYRKRKK